VVKSPSSAPTAAPAISIRGIGKSYSGVTVLHDIDLDIGPGEVHSLVGENGAGKSTLLKILGGAIRADHGTVRFDGEPITLGNPRDAISHGVSLISRRARLCRPDRCWRTSSWHVGRNAPDSGR